MPGRSRQPINLIEAKGRKHLTKAEIEERKKSEIQAPSDKIRAPSYLDKELKKEFNKLAKELKEVGIMTNLDVDALARFVIAKKMYVDITKKIVNNPGLLLDKDTVGVQDKLFKQCRSSASDLGLTISSRCKLAVPKPEKKEPTEFEKKFGDI